MKGDKMSLLRPEALVKRWKINKIYQKLRKNYAKITASSCDIADVGMSARMASGGNSKQL